jgi:hypothetical protein
MVVVLRLAFDFFLLRYRDKLSKQLAFEGEVGWGSR